MNGGHMNGGHAMETVKYLSAGIGAAALICFVQAYLSQIGAAIAMVIAAIGGFSVIYFIGKVICTGHF